MTSVLTFLRSFQNSPAFANLALHAYGGYGLAYTLGMKWPEHRLVIALAGIAAAALKEFWFDTNYEINPDGTVGQPIGTLSSGGSMQDFAGYMIGGAGAIAAWLL